MELINISASIDASADLIWPLFSDFGAVDRLFPAEGLPPLGFITKVDNVGEGVGAIRIMHFSDSVPIEERLTHCDHGALVMEYEAAALPMGVENYRARISFQRGGSGDPTVITYTAQGVSKSLSQSEVRDMLAPLFQALVARARQITEPG